MKVKYIKSASQIRREKPYYFVSIYGENLFESESIKECKDFLINYLKENEISEDDAGEIYIGMFNIDIMN